MSSTHKTVEKVVERPSNYHWVGDGFPVRSMIDYKTLGRETNPFSLLDYSPPYYFEPHFRQRGVGLHPHRGFENVTLLYKGSIVHKDSHGGTGVILPGDVQWMTAGSGILHEEFHTEAFTKSGGDFEMVQMWINLPAKHKMVPPTYREIADAFIPRVKIPGGVVKIVAGDFANVQGPATTYSPISMLDITVGKDAAIEIPVTPHWVCIVLVRKGSLKINGKKINCGDLAVLTKLEPTFIADALEDSLFLVLSGEPLNEPTCGQGPFMMNTPDEIEMAFEDFQNGKFAAP